MGKKSKGNPAVLRFTVKPVGPSRSEKQIRQDIADALEEAVEKLKTETSKKDFHAEVEPEGAFLGVAVATWWLLKAFGAGLVGGVGGAAGKRLFEYFSDSLQKRNLDPGSPSIPEGGEAEKKKKSKAAGKSAKGGKRWR